VAAAQAEPEEVPAVSKLASSVEGETCMIERVLRVLRSSPGLDATSIAFRLGVKPDAARRILDKMLKRGLVRRRTSVYPTAWYATKYGLGLLKAVEEASKRVKRG